MAFDYSTIDELREVVADIARDTKEINDLRARSWPAMKDDVTEGATGVLAPAPSLDQAESPFKGWFATPCRPMTRELPSRDVTEARAPDKV